MRQNEGLKKREVAERGVNFTSQVEGREVESGEPAGGAVGDGEAIFVVVQAAKMGFQLQDCSFL